MAEELIAIIDDEGNETLFEILVTFSLDEYKKDYICVTPISEEEDLDEKSSDSSEEVTDIFVFSYIPDETGNHGNLEEVVDEEEWLRCEEVINNFIDSEDF